MADEPVLRPHIIVGRSGVAEPYTYPRGGGGGDGAGVPERDRNTQQAKLHRELSIVSEQHQELAGLVGDLELQTPVGVQISFDSFPGIEMAFESLANAPQKIELLNVRLEEDTTHANVMLLANKVDFFEKKLEDYSSHATDKNGKPRDNRKLIDSIQSIESPTIESLWSDHLSLYPSDTASNVWWEVWLPVFLERNVQVDNFRKISRSLEIEVSESVLEFPERTVLLVYTSADKISSSALLLSQIGELRKAKETAEYFDTAPYNMQDGFANDLIARLSPLEQNVPYICILDTGVNSGHPLLKPFIASQLVVNSQWSANDDQGHGTGMAGLSVWGDLVELLNHSDPITIKHQIESVKVLRHDHDNVGKHLGNVTADGISAAENDNHERQRVFAMALSAKESKDRGKPSAWSAEVDAQVCDYLGENANPRLILVCAGNTGEDLTLLKTYPEYNMTSEIQDPGQAWNAVTVGGYTNKVHITDEDAEAYTPLAPAGGLSPYSSTSQVWASASPFKPEIVMEAGNVGEDDTSCAGMTSLKLLTTDSEIQDRLFTSFDGTSAATALASKFAAEIYAEYPNLWPETVRALMIHSASWTPSMTEQFSNAGRTNRQRAIHIARNVGHGLPDITKAIWSMNNSVSIVVEDVLQPYHKEKGKGVSTKDLHLHELPWPQAKLLDLGETEVKMTVTLSYFIEPNPSSRSISDKYRYPSHQLKFEVKRPTDSLDEFRRRITKVDGADDISGGETSAPGDGNWLMGNQQRHKGSVHKDVWTGTAAELAERSHLIVYPSTGWWRTRTGLQKYEKPARYSMIVTIEAPGVEVDLYTDVQNLVSVPVQIETAINTETI